MDNVIIFGLWKQRVRERCRRVQAASDQSSLPLEWTHEEPVLELTSLGLDFHLRSRRLLNKPRRVWTAIFAAEAILRRRRLHGAVMRCWNGHVVHLLQLEGWRGKPFQSGALA